MSLLKPCPIFTDAFHYDGATNTFTAEASGLPRMGRVYDDACDVGYTLISERTGREVVFVVTHEERDREGELLWTDLTPARPTPGHSCGTVRVYND